jgi:hypothetical protein
LLYHVSEQSGIERFEPRSVEGGEAVVWAVDSERLRNYMLPRDCPRVTFYAGPDSTADDVARFLGASPAVVAVESGWLDRIRSCRLFVYHLPADSFECIDLCAGYYVSEVPVVPAAVEVIDDPMACLLRRGVELRFLPELWDLRDAVAASTLQFSIIRMRNAGPRVMPASIG